MASNTYVRVSVEKPDAVTSSTNKYIRADSSSFCEISNLRSASTLSTGTESTKTVILRLLQNTREQKQVDKTSRTKRQQHIPCQVCDHLRMHDLVVRITFPNMWFFSLVLRQASKIKSPNIYATCVLEVIRKLNTGEWSERFISTTWLF